MGSLELSKNKCNGGQEVSLLDAQLELYSNTFAVIKSMALKSALDLGIADAVHRHGGAATLAEIASEWVLHDWGDNDCIKILKNCKKSITPRDKGGKVIIMDIVVGAGPSDQKHREVQALFDMYIMLVNGIERDEQEWKKVFVEAGFSGYKIMPILGFRSMIEVYP
uniref:O-methyltransferase C-terminal domain-containing protein n=1 Tax=Oryza rufipogon TaxID=4529 RepID=A0A0E0PPY4_ORYRU